jgi:oligopeptide/dipeptide ABC transporter ATP-binding protein
MRDHVSSTGPDREASVSKGPLLDVRGLTVEYATGRRRPPVLAVDDVSLTVDHGETVGLVGESGSGKSTIGRAVLGLTRPRKGRILFDGRDITHAARLERRALSREVQVVFQDPASSLNPVKRVGETLSEPLLVHERLGRDAAVARVEDMLELVGLPREASRRYPAQFSGGQRQRIAIARALMVSPRLVICDEPVSALDLSIQAQVLNLLVEIQAQRRLSYLFIAHDLSVVYYLCQRIIVLYRGRVMEQGPAEAVYRSPAHPYTRALLASAPVPDPSVQRARQREMERLATPPRVTADPRRGCVFAPRCPAAIDVCWNERPPLFAGRVACHRQAELNPEGLES